MFLSFLWCGFVLAAAPKLYTAEPQVGDQGFRFAPVNEKSLGLWEGTAPVLVYNHGTISKEGVPADRSRSTYIHPIYGLDGEVITDDFPKDHYHHRGLYWAWPHVIINNQEHSTWDLRGAHQQFGKWLEQKATTKSAVLKLENGWFVGNKKVMQEEVQLHVFPATHEGRAINVELAWTALDSPVTLKGAPNKSYGGFTLRYAPRTDTIITTPLGTGKKDLAVTQLPWADLSAQFKGATRPSGAAIFIGKDHPDYPPTWLTRHYGVLCVGWPGVKSQTLPVGRTTRCHYRIWIHRGVQEQSTLQKKYDQYVNGNKKSP